MYSNTVTIDVSTVSIDVNICLCIYSKQSYSFVLCVKWHVSGNGKKLVVIYFSERYDHGYRIFMSISQASIDGERQNASVFWSNFSLNLEDKLKTISAI